MTSDIQKSAANSPTDHEIDGAGGAPSSPSSTHPPQHSSAHSSAAEPILLNEASPGDAPDDATVISQRAAMGPSAARHTQPHELGKLLAGEKLDHFVLEAYVGGGGMGAVFRALDTMLNREVAIKVLSRDQGSDDDTRRRFQNEAQSAARLDHENIARVFYVGEDRGLHYIVFEFIEGTNLREVVEQRGPLPISEAVYYTLQIAEALEHAASRDVVHRDIKPSNVLIMTGGRAKLVDMGLARLHQVQAPGNDLTASGVTLGTFDYISPEQARDPRSADTRSDIYSLGCMLFYVLTGRPPFPDGTVLQKLLQHQGDDPPDPRDFNPHVPELLTVLLKRMLAKDPRKRFQTPRELIDELISVSQTLGLRGMPVPATAWDASEPASPSLLTRHLPWLAAVGVLLAIVVGDLAYSAWFSPPLIFPKDGLLADSTKPDGRAEAGTNAATQPSERARSDDSKQKSTVAPDSTKAGTAKSTATKTTPSTGAVAAATATPPRQEVPHDFTMTEKPPETVTLSAAESGAGVTLASATTPATTGATPLTEKLPPGMRVVGDGIGEQYYPSLRAAANAAKDNDVIELRYNGRREEKPFVINNRKVTVRASNQFKPIVLFRPNDAMNAGMIGVSGGQVTLVNLAIEFELPSAVVSDRWTLFDVQRTESLLLQGCSLTVRSASQQQQAYQRGVSFFAVRSVPGAESMMASGMMTAGKPVPIRLERCVARGEATLLRVSELEPAHLTWTNGLLATTEELLLVGGGSTEPMHTSHITVELNHLTVLARSGLCRFVTSVSNPFLLPADVTCASSILYVNPEAALVEHTGPTPSEEFRKQFTWSGDRNFYEGTSTFWKITATTNPASTEQLLLGEWKAKWGPMAENMPVWGQVVWKQFPSADRLAHTLTQADFVLQETPDGNPARRGASDGSDAGFEAAQLPALPPDAAMPSKPDASRSPALLAP